MAIIVEEEKGRVNIVSSLGWFIILGIIAVAAYYIFFASAPTVVITPPDSLANITPISQVTLDPNTVLGNAQFQALQQYIPAPSATGPSGVGRSNPFIAP